MMHVVGIQMNELACTLHSRSGLGYGCAIVIYLLKIDLLQSLCSSTFPCCNEELWKRHMVGRYQWLERLEWQLVERREWQLVERPEWQLVERQEWQLGRWNWQSMEGLGR